eukprot:TRINITY_DN6063_c0_g2_i2.p1 TRINITY_DN6063_c0_g2~~TRINITY_DN6063_c0_g2_i2.p1  ORF type:complete len:184 (-),score=47.79 TRINITY_DN6063_c0_g2_i2:52-603(-)
MVRGLKKKNKRDRYKENTKERRIALVKKKAEQIEEKKQRELTYKDDPDWFYYPELDFWIHRSDLEQKHIRLAIGSIHANMTWTKDKKIKLVEDLKRVVSWVDNLPAKKREIFQHLADDSVGIPKEKQKHRQGLVYSPQFQEHTLRLPSISWEQLIEDVEADMDPELRTKRYDFSPPSETDLEA